jgi:hypothetical protein
MDPAIFRRDASSIPIPTADSAITSTTVRLPLRGILRDLLEAYTHHSDLIKKAPSASKSLRDSVARSQARVDAVTVRKGRPPLYGPAHYAQVAGVYTEAISQGRYPTKAVGDRWAVNKRTAAGWVERARKQGFLSPTTRGRATVAPKEDA